MADISKIEQRLTQFGPAPDSLDPSNFNQRADATVAHLHTHVTEQNVVVEQINKVTSELNTRAKDLDEKYDEVVDKHTDFIPKYNDAVEKHGQIVTMHEEVKADTSHVDARKNEIDAIKTHIDQTKTQIDADLEIAKSRINEGNGGVIDDTKTSDVSTWSSKFLTEKLAKKMDNTQVYTQEQSDERFVNKLTSNFLATDVFQKNNSGYMKLSNGFIIQWKRLVLEKGTTYHTYRQELFPIAFTNRCLGGMISGAYHGEDERWNSIQQAFAGNYGSSLLSFTKSQFYAEVQSYDTHKNYDKHIMVLAFGY